MIRTRARSVVASTTPSDVPQRAVIANGQLPAIVERIEKLEADRSATTADIRDMYMEAKGQGYNVKALRGSSASGVRTRRSAPKSTWPWKRIGPSWAWSPALSGMAKCRFVRPKRCPASAAPPFIAICPTGKKSRSVGQPTRRRRRLAGQTTCPTRTKFRSVGQPPPPRRCRRRLSLPAPPEARAAVTLSSGG